VSSILSAISGQFSKSLILGTFMPVLLFVILNLLFVLPYLPNDPQVLQQISEVNTRAVLGIMFVTVVLTGLLYNLNIPIIRFYEGYTWQGSKIGQWRTGRYEKELRPMLELRPRVQDAQDAMIRRVKGETKPEILETIETQMESLNSIRSKLGKNLSEDFPGLTSVLPTKLGNVIRSFESYPQRQYNMAGITLYPRLIAKVDKEYLEQIDNAKSSFDFMINCSVLSGVLALAVLVVGLLFPGVLSAPGLVIYWLVKIFLFFFICWAFYASSIGRASEWGDLVKGAFDLYRWKLLEQFGFERTPATMEEERILWGSISAQMIFGDRPNARLLEYANIYPYARGVPQRAKLETVRGLSKTQTADIIKVTVMVKNTDTQTVKNVVITDTLPEDSDYVWNSAKFSRTRPKAAASLRVLEDVPDGSEIPVFHPAPVSGANPYRFKIGDLPHGQQVQLTYRALRKK
jgi:uncharacterized repeat protein (TIGR01451 family)